MKRINLFAIILLSCFTTFAQGKLNPAKKTRNWYTGQSLELMFQKDSSHFHPERKSGNNWVFEFTLQKAEYEDVSDDEMSETISFEVVPNRSGKFSLKNAELKQAKAYYMLGCFCMNRGYHLVDNGTISGVRMNASTWIITIDLWIDAQQQDGKPIRKKIKERFTLTRS